MYPLTPIIHNNVEKSLINNKKVEELLLAFGSPINFVYPEIVTENFKKFKKVIDSYEINGEIFYAHKANKSTAILKQLALSNCKIDVASEKELKQALSAGFVGSRIEATGPKNQSFIRLSLLHRIIINLNSLDELKVVLALRDRLNIEGNTPIFIRLKEFKSSQANILKKDTKFGLSIDESKEAMAIIKKKKESLNFMGFSFHLTTTSEKEKTIAIEQSFQLTLEAMKIGLSPQGINIGGGFGLNYLANKKEWHNYVSALKDSLLNPNKPVMSWNQSGLGFWAEKGKIRGVPKFIDFYRDYNQFEELSRVLNTQLPLFGKIAQFLQENMLKLYMEPGCSLLDQAGITLARVNSINKSLKGETVVFLDMNRSHINSIELEFMSDPILLPTGEKRINEINSNGVFLSGNLCLLHDFICRRKVFFPKTPQIGDILAFINTAGYFMDFTESETIQHPKAPKIAINSLGWSIDEKYEPNNN